jgi:hypothetical protein
MQRMHATIVSAPAFTWVEVIGHYYAKAEAEDRSIVHHDIHFKDCQLIATLSA